MKNARTTMLEVAGLLAASICAGNVRAAPPELAARDDARPRAHDSDVYAWSLTSSGYHTGAQGVGGNSGFALSWRPTSFIEPEVLLSEGLFFGEGTNLFRVSAGARFVLPLASLRPFVFGAFTHAHNTPLAAFVEKPVPAGLSLSEAGVVHRQGVEGGVGITVPADIETGRDSMHRIDLMLRASAVYLPGFGASSAGAGEVVGLVELGVGAPVKLNL